MKSRSLKLLAYALGISIIAAMVFYLVGQRDLFATLKTLDLPTLALVMGLASISTLNYGGRFKIGANVFDVSISYWQALSLSATNTMLNYAIPLKGGMIMRAAYMKQRYGFTYTDYGALLASSQLIAIALGGLIGLALCLIAWVVDDVGSAMLTLVFAASTVGSVVGFLLTEKMDFGRFLPERLGDRVKAFRLGFARWRLHPLAVLKFAGSLLATIVFTGVRLFIIFRAIGADVPMAPLLAIGAAVSVSSALSLTPGNLGIREAIIALSATLLGVDGRIALLVSLIDRAAGIVVMVAIGLGFSHTLVKRRDPKSAADSSLPESTSDEGL